VAKTDREPFTVVANPMSERPPARRWIRWGYLVLGGFVGAVALWGYLAPIESAAVAIGSVSLDTNRKTVQHLEGGIVEKLLVKEAQAVEKDQILIQLDTTQPRERIALLAAKIKSAEAQLKLLRSEIETVEGLLKKGLAQRPRLLALQRREAELVGELGEHQAQMRVAEDAIARATIKAPVSGVVIELKIHTTGGVIKAGEPLMAIVPRDEPLTIEAQIEPNDIDVVRPGLAAHVRLTPYNVRFAPPMPGKVVHVSADRFTDQKSGANYYLARIELTKKPNDIDPSIKLYPGMPAEVIIVTGERTMFDYLAAPITRSFRKAFRED
jgi:multidrug efflux pump subunit AcrA (membrane-fusion protein)